LTVPGSLPAPISLRAVRLLLSAQAKKKGIALLTDQKTKEFLAEPGYYEP
jgi:hypothetical protein